MSKTQIKSPLDVKPASEDVMSTPFDAKVEVQVDSACLETSGTLALTTETNLGRSRGDVLNQLIPIMLGLLWERGRPVDASRRFVHIGFGRCVELAGFTLREGLTHIHMYDFVGGDWEKVFSAYLSHHPLNDRRYKYCAGQCSILSWKRGAWERLVAAQAVEPRSIEQVANEGLTRNSPL